MMLKCILFSIGVFNCQVSINASSMKIVLATSVQPITLLSSSNYIIETNTPIATGIASDKFSWCMYKYSYYLVFSVLPHALQLWMIVVMVVPWVLLIVTSMTVLVTLCGIKGHTNGKYMQLFF